MLNRAPYNTEVPQFLPSRDAPINSYITRKYPCQEQLAGKANAFSTLTWKIQQPDPTMVWQSVKVVLPVQIQVYREDGDYQSMDVGTRLPTSNIALASSPMNAFRQTSLSINGRIFSEDNFYRDILDACYRGVGTQAYGDNHSLKPIVNRAMVGRSNVMKIVQFNAGSVEHPDWQNAVTNQGRDLFAHVDDVEEKTLATAFTLLEHNGPFIERARIFQDKLDKNGTTWSGEISSLLELGPFQARARKGNTAVPYIQDFHLRLNFASMQSKFDSINPSSGPKNVGVWQEVAGRTLAPKLLEFATLPNFLHKNEQPTNLSGWPGGFEFTYTAQPYLEVMYTKHEDPMRDSYNLRCFEHLYEKSNRFRLVPPDAADPWVSPSSLQRVTSRVLSLPTKIYVWAEASDEYKYAFAMGGVRRSCLLENLHLRVNQRPDVMFNPSQEECYEMFRRHTNSNLEYGSWLKSPIYCFDMVDVGQPDMYSNDARITWFEWDAEVKLTPLQMVETANLEVDDYLSALAYDRSQTEVDDMEQLGGGFSSVAPHGLMAYIDWSEQPEMNADDADMNICLTVIKDGSVRTRGVNWNDAAKMKHQVLRLNEALRDQTTHGEFIIDTIIGKNMRFDGFIWGLVRTVDQTDGDGKKGDVYQNQLYYVPESYRFKLLEPNTNVFNPMSAITYNSQAGTIKLAHPEAAQTVIKATYVDNNDADFDGKTLGTIGAQSGCKKAAPGEFAYKIDGTGIHNDTLLTGEEMPSVDQSQMAQKFVWMCFQPQQSMPAWMGGDTWMEWLTTQDADDLNGMGAPKNWGNQTQGQDADWQLGFERLNVACGGSWQHTDDFENVSTLTDNPIGAQLVAVQPLLEQQAKTASQMDYQLKVLYEYGNCQYNFARNATPTRILPNVVPVGPSPGIPAPL